MPKRSESNRKRPKSEQGTKSADSENQTLELDSEDSSLFRNMIIKGAEPGSSQDRGSKARRRRPQ